MHEILGQGKHPLFEKEDTKEGYCQKLQNPT
jgi:hypothetical protein